MPQLELQQTRPVGQTALPHCSPLGTQSCFVHPLPGSTQMPQLGLQHSSPALQMVEPHCLSEGGVTGMGGQICAVHIMPGLVQRPQDGLQQVKPASHTVFPHLTPSMGTHWAFPSITLHVVLMVHLTVAQGVIASLETGSIGLP